MKIIVEIPDEYFEDSMKEELYRRGEYSLNITSVKDFTNLEVAKRLISDSWGVFKNITVLDVNDSNDSYLVDMNTNILHLIEKFSNHKGDKRTNSLNWLAGQFERHKAKCLELIQEDL